MTSRNWKGILVEPVPYIFNRLKRNYNGFTGLIFENIAISKKTEIRNFWYLEENDELDKHYDQIGSFYKTHLLKHKMRFPGLEKYIRSFDVKCMGLEELIIKHNLKIDLIVIDAEKYDNEIVLQINLKKYKPYIIIYEHAHISYKQQQKCISYLTYNGYKIDCNSRNTMAFLNKIKT